MHGDEDWLCSMLKDYFRVTDLAAATSASCRRRLGDQDPIERDDDDDGMFSVLGM